MEEMKVSQLTCAYGKNRILTNMSFHLRAGEIVALTGPNGCGKSTLLQVLAGLKKPKMGEIYFDQKPATAKMLIRKTGYVPQFHFLAEECSVKDNLLLWYENRKQLEQELEEGFLKELGIPRFLHKKCGSLSGGMQKKVSIACALSTNPEILLLDEPCASLDLASKQQLREYLTWYVHDSTDKKRAVLMATHEEIDVEYCDRVIELLEPSLK